MTTLKERVEAGIRQALDIETGPLFPALYDGFKEADALAEGEDAILEILKTEIYNYFQNRNIQTMSVKATEEFERGLRIAGAGTIDERREAVANVINSRFVLNDAKLHEICSALAPGFTVYERTDPQALTLGVFTEEDAEDGTLLAVGIVDEIRPTVPQNLALYAGVETEFNRPVVVNHAHFSALWAGLGTVERHVPDIVMFYTINKTTGEETRGNKEPDIGAVVKGGSMFEGSKQPALQNLGNNLFFTISKTPDA